MYWHLSYLLGRHQYQNRQYERALRLLAKVERPSKYYGRAQFLSGIANVQMRHPVDAVRSFANIVQPVDASNADRPDDDRPDDDRLRDLASLSIARTYYSASVRLDARGATDMNKSGVQVALKHWNAVDPTSEYWLEAFFEQSWAYFMMGDHARALGNVHTLTATNLLTGYNPEVDILKSTIYVANCQYDDATTLAARFQTTYQPVASELTRTLAAIEGADQDEGLYELAKDVRAGGLKLPALIRPVVTQALGDRQFLRHLQYVTVLEDELKRIARTPSAFRDSALGGDMKDGTQRARDIAVRNVAEVARERAKRRGDEEHVIWPFTGELWSDEVGTYRQSIRSKCR